MSHRFFVEPPISADQSEVTLTGTEAQHLLKVMRAKKGELLVLFDDSGDEFLAELMESGRNEALFKVVERIAVDRERSPILRLAVALPKGDRQRVLIEKSVELGVGELIPLTTARSTDHYSAKSIERWQRYVIDASKQCGRNRLMKFAPIVSMHDFIEHTTGPAWIAHPAIDLSETIHGKNEKTAGELDGEVAVEFSRQLTSVGNAPITLAIGPEGGFTSEEVKAALTAGWHRLDLGPRILRIETAAVVAISRFDQLNNQG